jgi:ATP-dependent Clp protease ATP-binding subunit ClpA
VDFKNTLIIMTSNVGSSVIERGGRSFGFLLRPDDEEAENDMSYARIKGLVNEELKSYFRWVSARIKGLVSEELSSWVSASIKSLVSDELRKWVSARIKSLASDELRSWANFMWGAAGHELILCVVLLGMS